MSLIYCFRTEYGLAWKLGSWPGDASQSNWIMLRGRFLTAGREVVIMKMTDLKSIEEWEEFERKINERFGINGVTYDAEGTHVTSQNIWANKLCPVIKENKASLQAICSVAHQNANLEVVRGRKPVVMECDAGFLKIGLPVFVEEELLGLVGGCGLLADEGEVETFLVGMAVGLDEKEIEELARNAARMSDEQVKAFIGYLEEQVAEILSRPITPPG